LTFWLVRKKIVLVQKEKDQKIGLLEKMRDFVIVDEPSRKIKCVPKEERVIIGMSVVCFGNKDIEVRFPSRRIILGEMPEVLEAEEGVKLHVRSFGKVEVLSVYDCDGLVYLDIVTLFKFDTSC